MQTPRHSIRPLRGHGADGSMMPGNGALPSSRRTKDVRVVDTPNKVCTPAGEETPLPPNALDSTAGKGSNLHRPATGRSVSAGTCSGHTRQTVSDRPASASQASGSRGARHRNVAATPAPNSRQTHRRPIVRLSGSGRGNADSAVPVETIVALHLLPVVGHCNRRGPTIARLGSRADLASGG